MRKFTATMLMLGSLVATTVGAQESDNFAPSQRVTTGAASAHSPRLARASTSTEREQFARDYIRTRAQEKAAARRDRIEGMRAIGFSPARPTVNALPFMSHPPTWHVTSIWAYPAWNPFWYYPVNAMPSLTP